MRGMENTNHLLPIGPMARRLRVPVKWLREQAEASRVPHLRAGSRLLFNAEAVERVLLDRAADIGGRAVQS